ncbi:MAG: alpha/beta fold hydrolase [Planctomycetes bacterium]|nr:alpha/beta fold hydrolase [Planctomycetota bacterium]
MTHAVYLHGFASSPRSAKGIALGARLAATLGADGRYVIPDLEAGDFRGLTMDLLASRAEAALRALPADGAPVLLIGSSLGGYTAAWLAAKGRAHRVSGLLLIAPAFGFTDSWASRLGDEGIAAWRRDGQRPFFHHAVERELPLGAAFYESCLALPALPGQAPMPAAIVQGRQDQSVDHRQSVAYASARERVELHLVDGDHRLTEARHEDLIAWCARDLIARM